MQHNRADHFYARRPLRLSENPFSYNRLFTYPQHPKFFSTHTVNVFSQFVNRVAGEWRKDSGLPKKITSFGSIRSFTTLGRSAHF